MDQGWLIGLGVLHLLAAVDIAFSRLSGISKVLWVLLLGFVPGVGLATWLLTRHTAYHPAPETSEEASAEAA